MNEINQAAVALHDQAVILYESVRKAIGDRRFKLTLDEARKIRDLIDDAELVANRAWRGTLQIEMDGTKEYIEVK